MRAATRRAAEPRRGLAAGRALPAPLSLARPRGGQEGRPHPRLRGGTRGNGPRLPRRRIGSATDEARRARRRRVVRSGPQPDRLRPAIPQGGEARPAAADLPAVDTLRLSPLAFPRNPYHRLVKHYQDGGLVRGRINDPELDARLALEVFGEQREALRKAEPGLLAAWHWLTTPEHDGVDSALDGFFSALRGAPRPVKAEAHVAIGRRLAGDACATHARVAVAEADQRRLGAGLCAGLALGRGRRLGHAALGAPPVPGSGASGAPPPGHGLRRSRLRLVPGAPRCPQGDEALVRLRRFPAGTGGGRRAPHAAGHRRRGDGGHACARHPAHRHRQVALLPDPRDLPLRQDRRADGGDLAPGRADGGPGGGAGEAWDRVLRDRQRDALHARAVPGAGACAPRRRGHPPDRAGAAPQPLPAPGARPARDRRLGAGRGPLPLALGPRLPPRLPLREPLHPREGG